jgi:hypothetical protein
MVKCSGSGKKFCGGCWIGKNHKKEAFCGIWFTCTNNKDGKLHKVRCVRVKKEG